MRLEAIAELEALHPDMELIFVESGGDNLAAAFSPELGFYSCVPGDCSRHGGAVCLHSASSTTGR